MSSGYQPLYIRKPEVGLVQNRQEFLLPDDAFPILENAFVWREQIKRRQGLATLGRLRRVNTLLSLGLSGASPWTFTIWSTLVPPIVPETDAEIEVGSVHIFIGATELIDQGDGTLATSPVSGVTGVINYLTGVVTITGAGAGVATTITFNYFPGLPVMGLRARELNSINVEQLIAFDTVYAYRYINGWREFIPGTTWTGQDFNFFWSTNYWVTPAPSNNKIFWVTNFTTGDPIRYTEGTVWIDFAPKINAANDVLAQCLAMLPFRGRLVAFNTIEGQSLATGTPFTNRIRWAAIGNPISDISALFPLATNVNVKAWKDDIRGQGGFLDIPTSEAIVAVGFVRDNLVIYCERSTWQLRYTGRSIAPFQIEKVNSELGSESTFSAVQFDTSLIGIGDKGVVECDSFKSERIDIKIPDLVFEFKNDNNGTERVHGIRDFQQRLAYWTYVYNPGDNSDAKFPNRRLIYNYENDSWAIFTDSLTTFGNFQNPTARTWAQSTFPWSTANFPWLDIPTQFPSLVAGNQQGYVMYLSSNLQPKVNNDPTLFISNITGNVTTPTVVTSPNHNLVTGQIITIENLVSTDPFFASLNNPKRGVITGATQAFPCQITSANHGLLTGFSVTIDGIVGMTQLNGFTYVITSTGLNTFTLDGINSTNFTAYSSGGTWSYLNVFAVVIPTVNPLNTFQLWTYSPITQQFSNPQLDPAGTYLGGAEIAVRDNFSIVSKKFNFLEQGENIQMGYIDVLMVNTSTGTVSMNVYLDYNDNAPINILPENVNPTTGSPDTFFNNIVNTFSAGGIASSKNWQRVFCPVRGNFITLQWTLSNEQMTTIAQESNVQIDAQILWVRPAGKQLPNI